MVKHHTDTGYMVEFPNGLEPGSKEAVGCPGKTHRFHEIPFIIRGEPGLLNACFQFRQQGNELQDVYKYDLSSVLHPTGMFTNFYGSVQEMKGSVSIPERFFPVEIVDIKVENLSNEQG